MPSSSSVGRRAGASAGAHDPSVTSTTSASSMHRVERGRSGFSAHPDTVASTTRVCQTQLAQRLRSLTVRPVALPGRVSVSSVIRAALSLERWTRLKCISVTRSDG